MNLNFSFKETMERHKAMWNWIADYYENPFTQIRTIDELKSMYMQVCGLEKHDIYMNCFLCNYIRNINECCNSCPLAIYDKSDCAREDSLFNQIQALSNENFGMDPKYIAREKKNVLMFVEK